MKTRILTGVALIVAAAAGSLATVLLQPKTTGQAPNTGKAAEPLYWVAPMDPSYRRDAPGKSPMGMDLVPVYEEDGAREAPGTIRIDASVRNNLGVRSEEVRRRALKPSLRTVGFVRWDEDRLTHEHPRVSGWIEKLFVKAAGDPVLKGEPLYSLYSPDLVNAQEELVLALRRDDESLARAARERLAALQVPASLVSAIEKDRRVRQTVTFTASQDGIVDQLPIREGFYVEPGTTLMAIGALDSVWVEAMVLERQTDRISIGMPATMTTDYLPARLWEGSVDYVYPSLDPSTRTLRLRLRFDNTDRVLRPNMFTRVTLEAHPGKPVVAVPREAVIRTGEGDRVVLALGEGRFRATAVRVGASDERFFEILSGVAVGDRVVTSAQFLLDSESSQRAGLERLSAAKSEAGAAGPAAEHGNDTGPENHGTTDHGKMDHGTMDHSTMDHGATKHDATSPESATHGNTGHENTDGMQKTRSADGEDSP